MPNYPQMVPPALYNLQPRDIAEYLSTLPRAPAGALGSADGSGSLVGIPDVPVGWQPNQFSGIPPTGTKQLEAWMAPPTRRPVGVLMPERVRPMPSELALSAPPTPEPLGPNTAPYEGPIPGEIPDNPWGNSPQVQSYQQPPEMPGGMPRPLTQQQPNGRQPFEQLNQVPQNPLPQAAQMPQSQGQAQGQPGGMSNAALMGILSAGLGILANNTGHYGAAGPAIGKGGQIGLGTYLQQSQQEIENTRRDALASAAEARWRKTGEYQDALAQQMTRKGNRDEQQDLTVATLRDRYMKADTPDEKKAALMDLAAYSDPDAAFSALTRGSGKTKTQWVRKADPSNPEMEIPVLRNMETGEEIAQADPVRKGSLIGSIDLRQYDKTSELEMAKNYSDMDKQARSSDDYAQRVEYIAETLSDYTGGPIDVYLAKLGRLFPSGEYGAMTSKSDAAHSLQTMLATRVRVPGSGATSNFEMQMYLDAIPSLMTLKDGRELMVRLAKRVAEREAVAADLYDEMVRNGKYKSVDFKRILNERVGPLMNDEEKRHIKSLGGHRAPATQTGPSGPSPGAAWQEKNK